MLEKNDIFKIAIGTFGLANRREQFGFADQTFNEYSNEVDGLIYSLNKGQNYLSISYNYADGRAMKLLKHLFSQVDRDKIFVNVAIENYIEKVEDIENQLDKYLNIMGISYADSIMLHTPKASMIPLEDSYKELERLVSIGKSRYVSASNLNIEQLKMITEQLNIQLFSFEGLYNLECKYNEDVEIMKYCSEHEIIFLAYQSLRRNRTSFKNYPVLVELSRKYEKTQNQILLNWMVNEKNIYPIIKTVNPQNINSNIDALSFKMEQSDYNKLNEFRSPEFDALEVDWNDDGGTPIYSIANKI